VVRLRERIREGLLHHGVAAGDDDTPASLRDKLNDLYLEDVRRLKQRQVGGEIALGDYADHVLSLKQSYPLLGVPLHLWEERPEPEL
jgi:hypothetical protein